MRISFILEACQNAARNRRIHARTTARFLNAATPERDASEPIKLFLLGALAGGSAGFRALGGPVFRRKRDAPELRPRGRKLEADFGFVATHGAEENDLAFLIFGSLLVLDMDSAATRQPSLQKHQRAVRADSQGFGLFGKGLALCVHAADADGNLHENALAAAFWSGGRRVRKLGHGFSLLPILTAATAFCSMNRGGGSQKVQRS